MAILQRKMSLLTVLSRLMAILLKNRHCQFVSQLVLAILTLSRCHQLTLNSNFNVFNAYCQLIVVTSQLEIAIICYM